MVEFRKFFTNYINNLVQVNNPVFHKTLSFVMEKAKSKIGI